VVAARARPGLGRTRAWLRAGPSLAQARPGLSRAGLGRQGRARWVEPGLRPGIAVRTHSLRVNAHVCRVRLKHDGCDIPCQEHAGRRQTKRRQKDSLDVKARGANLLLQRGGVLQVTRAGAQWVPLAFPPRALATTAARNIWAALSFVPLIDLIFAVASRSSSLVHRALTCNTSSPRQCSN
jgi:hypothetical protein